MSKLVGIGEASRLLGVPPQTLRRWDTEGRLRPQRTEGGQRRYDATDLRPELFRRESEDRRKTVAYARVSSHDQKSDLEHQKQVLEAYCAAQGWTYEIVSDLGSGMNYRKQGLNRLLNAIMDGDVGRLVITHKDRLLRFGAELVFAICEARSVEVVVLNSGEDTTFEEDLARQRGATKAVDLYRVRFGGGRARLAISPRTAFIPVSLPDQKAIIDACCQAWNAWNALVDEPGRIQSLCLQPWLKKVIS